MRVTVQEYNPLWAEQFQEIKQQLESILQGTPYISIEHVGSTSVPGLAAKPVIDIDIIVKDDLQFNAVKNALTANVRGGTSDSSCYYEYRGDLGVPLRYAFRLLDTGTTAPRRNLYVCIEGCQSLLNHLAVRDLCRADPEVRQAYGKKKLELAAREWDGVDEYCEGKNDVLAWILDKAGWSAEDRIKIREINTIAPSQT